MTGLQFFSRTSDPKCFNLASYHSPANMCWSWIVSFSFFKPGEWRVWPLGWRYRSNTGLDCGLRVPFVGMLRWHRQYSVMPYRELYQGARDERDTLRDIKPRPPVRIVSDGGQALH